MAEKSKRRWGAWVVLLAVVMGAVVFRAAFPNAVAEYSKAALGALQRWNGEASR